MLNLTVTADTRYFFTFTRQMRPDGVFLDASSAIAHAKVIGGLAVVIEPFCVLCDFRKVC